MYCIDSNSDNPIMMLDRHIGFDSEDGMGIDGAAFAQELLQLDAMGKKSIQVYINCPGGNVMDGMNIYNAILKSKTPVDTHNVGIAASMGGVCFMAGRKRIMADYASLMLHNPAGVDDKKAMDSFKGSITQMLSAKSNVSSEDVGFLMDRTSWLNSAECFAKGFCTDIAITSDANKKYMKDAQDSKVAVNEEDDSKVAVNDSKVAVNMWKVGNTILNNAFKNTNDMKKVTAKLNLNEAATEDAIVSAIEGVVNNANATKAEADKLRTDLKDAQDKVTDIQNKLDAATASLKLVTDKATEDATAVLETRSLEMVTGFAKIGRIKNDASTIEVWKGLAVKDFDGTKKIIEDLPLNKVANKIELDNTSVDDKFKGTAAFKMHEIANRTK